jgi:hypothetical protein
MRMLTYTDIHRENWSQGRSLLRREKERQIVIDRKSEIYVHTHTRGEDVEEKEREGTNQPCYEH